MKRKLTVVPLLPDSFKYRKHGIEYMNTNLQFSLNNLYFRRVYIIFVKEVDLYKFKMFILKYL
jgi:hypothetical protein